MALDHALLNRVEFGEIQQPLLRIYRWNPHALSLGYHQRLDQVVDRKALGEAGVDLVRRPTGGWAVLHAHELTYAVVSPFQPPFSDSLEHNYAAISRALSLFSRSPVHEPRPAGQGILRDPRSNEPCFAHLSPSEIEAGAKKLIGSAQKLGRRGFLQHGSIPVRSSTCLLQRLTGTTLDMDQRMTCLAQVFALQGRALPSMDEFQDRLIGAFAQVFDADFLPYELSERDGDVGELHAQRYGNKTWVERI